MDKYSRGALNVEEELACVQPEIKSLPSFPPSQMESALESPLRTTESVFLTPSTLGSKPEQSLPSFPPSQMESAKSMESPLGMTESVFLTPSTLGLTPEDKVARDLGEPPKFDLSWSREEFHYSDAEKRPLPQIKPSFWSESQQVEERRLDIISRLVILNAYEILHTILECLSPSDLCRFATVSRSWHWALRLDSEARATRRTFLRTVRDENSRPCATERFLERTKDSRRALGSIGNQIAAVGIAGSEELYKKSPFPVGIDGTYRPCPKCRSPARESSAEARCSQCEYSFCMQCFKPWSSQHSCQPKVVKVGVSGEKDGRGKSGKYAVGSKQSKKRLKRL